MSFPVQQPEQPAEPADQGVAGLGTPPPGMPTIGPAGVPSWAASAPGAPPAPGPAPAPGPVPAQTGPVSGPPTDVTVAPRPGPVRVAAAVLGLMALGSLFYAVTGLALMGGIARRFERLADLRSVSGDDIEAIGNLLRAVPIVSAVVGVLAAALLLGLTSGLLGGRNGFRIATWAVCTLGVLAGGCAAIWSVSQRLGDWTAEGYAPALAQSVVDAHPSWWLFTSGALSVAQVLGYLVVALLLALPAANAFFRGNPPARA